MLYLKCHYPVQFYESVLNCTKPAGPKDYLKLKDYKAEAERHGIKINLIDVNKCGFNFKIVGNEIYYAFNKLRGLGDEAAAKMEKMQPYQGFEDFLKRFGCDAKGVQSMLALGQFTERDPITLYKFYEVFKKYDKNKRERKERYELIMEKYKKAFEELKETKAEEKVINKLKKKIEVCYRKFHEKDAEGMPSLKNFDGSDIEVKEEIVKLLTDQEHAESTFYGFIWHHPIEKSPDYTVKTIDRYLSEGYQTAPLEIMVEAIEKKKGKKATYYQLIGSDGNGESAAIMVWNSDYPCISELKPKDFISISVKPPMPPFRSFTIASGPRKVEKVDPRIIRMRKE
jgi:DNA polymerase III alpha subunit